MELPKETGYVVAFVAGAVTLYIAVRVASPALQQRITDKITDRVVELERTGTGFTILPPDQVRVHVATPIAIGVMEGLYLR